MKNSHINYSRKSYRKYHPLNKCKRDDCDELVENNRYDFCLKHCKKNNRALFDKRRSRPNPLVTKPCQYRGSGCLGTFQAKERSTQQFCKPCARERKLEWGKTYKKLYSKGYKGGVPDTSKEAIESTQKSLAKRSTIIRYKVDEEPICLMAGTLRERVRPNRKPPA